MIENKINVGHLLIVAASIIVILAGIRSASMIVVPFLLSFFLAIILAPFFLWLKRLGLGEILSLIIIVLFLLFFASLLITLVGSSVQDFSENIPLYELKLRTDMQDMFLTLDQWGLHVPKDDFLDIFQASSAMRYIAKTLKSLGSLLTNSFMIILTVIFMLLEISQFTNKLYETNSSSMKQFTEINNKIKHYMFIKALTSIATGVIVAIALEIIGIHYAILWGLLAFLLNFIPNIGSIIAAVPALLMALVQYNISIALVVGVVYLTVNILIGSILEPRILGRGLGLSPLIIFLSLILWGWLLGPLGMLLSVPLTIIIKIALSAQPNTQWLANLLSSSADAKSKQKDTQK